MCRKSYQPIIIRICHDQSAREKTRTKAQVICFHQSVGKKCLRVEVQDVCHFLFSLLEKVAPDFTVNHTEQ